MQGFFDNLIGHMIEAIQGSLNRAEATGHQCDYMLVVGGFGGFPYLITRLRAASSHQVLKEVVSPGVPSQAILKGVLEISISCLNVVVLHDAKMQRSSMLKRA